jgi:hypothetical protein
VIHTWDVKDGCLKQECRGKPITLSPVYGSDDKPPVTRALTVSPLDEDIILGTASCDILEVKEGHQVRASAP